MQDEINTNGSIDVNHTSSLSTLSKKPPRTSKFSRGSFGLIIACSLEANRRGLTETEIGIIIGAFAVTTFFFTFLFGRNITNIGAKLLLCCGMLVVGVSQIIFGLLYYVTDAMLFRNLCILTRVLEGVGNTAASLSSIAIMSSSFPDHLGFVFSTIEIFAGLGGILGPFVGGALFRLGGYEYPFYICGVFQIFTLIVCSIIIAPPEEMQQQVKQLKILDYYKLTKFKSIFVCCLMTASSSAILGLFDTGFSLFLYATFKLDEFHIGLCFIPSSLSYMLIGFLVGYVSDKSQSMGRAIMVIGGLLQTISCVLVGPIPALRKYFYPTLPSVLCLQIVFGMGLACSLMPAYNEMVLTSKRHNYIESIQLYGLISAVFNASYAVGEGFGPIVGGWVISKKGFEWALAVFSGSITLVTIIMFTVYLTDNFAVKKQTIEEEDTEQFSI